MRHSLCAVDFCRARAVLELAGFSAELSVCGVLPDAAVSFCRRLERIDPVCVVA